MIKFSSLILACMILLSSCSVNNHHEPARREFGKIKRNLINIPLAEADMALIDHSRHSYKANPYNPEYKELVLMAILLDSKNKSYVFDVLYQDGLQVVFVFNEQGEEVGNFMLSTWDRYED